MAIIKALSVRHNSNLDRYQVYIELSNGESMAVNYPAISSTDMAVALKEAIYWLDKGGDKIAYNKG